MDKTLERILDFWFSSPMNKHWFASTNELDQQLKELFESDWRRAKAGDYDHWCNSAEGCLALVILFDQIPLNIFRGQTESFSTEQAAIEITKFAIDNDLVDKIDITRRSFLFMPLMHSENMQDQELAVACFEKSGLNDNLRFALHHKDIISRFGRFPHRNSILGRQSRPEELEYLNSDQAFQG